MAAPQGTETKGHVFHSRSRLDSGSSAFVSQLRQLQSPKLALASVRHLVSLWHHPFPSSPPVPARKGAWQLPSLCCQAFGGCCWPG